MGDIKIQRIRSFFIEWKKKWIASTIVIKTKADTQENDNEIGINVTA